MHILALIPARSGSKSVPHKNIRLLRGRPLIALSIEHARASDLISRVIVSTDSAEYAEIAKRYGAEAPFLRPAKLAEDLSTDLETFEHALNWLRINEGYAPDIVVHLRPTYPVRRVSDIDAMIQLLIERPELDSVRSIVPAPDTPFKMWLRDEAGLLMPVAQTELREAYNAPRQLLPPAYLQNASIDVVRASVIMDQHSMTGQRIHGYLMTDNFDIDTEAQLGAVAVHLGDGTEAATAGKTFCFDIDGVIATLTEDNQYDQARPQWTTIDLINQLHERGHQILLFTARGALTGIDWTATTKRQMAEWGVKYHRLIFGKPAADHYVDDRAIPPDQLAELVRHLS